MVLDLVDVEGLLGALPSGTTWTTPGRLARPGKGAGMTRDDIFSVEAPCVHSMGFGRDAEAPRRHNSDGSLTSIPRVPGNILKEEMIRNRTTYISIYLNLCLPSAHSSNSTHYQIITTYDRSYM